MAIVTIIVVTVAIVISFRLCFVLLLYIYVDRNTAVNCEARRMRKVCSFFSHYSENNRSKVGNNKTDSYHTGSFIPFYSLVCHAI